MNYNETLEYIHSLLKFGIKPGMERIDALLEKLGNPQNKLKCIHVAGTNGKGSTCAYISSVLQAAGYRVGLFTSPFVVDFRERIQICGRYITENEISALASEIRCIAEENEAVGLGPTEFEFITALAFEYFNGQGCDYAVIETGLGGLLDSTNVISNPLVSVITNIAYDHTAVLGDTIEEITAQKCGIIKHGCPVVLSPQSHDYVEKAVAGYALENDCSFTICESSWAEVVSSGLSGSKFIYDNEEYSVSMIGRHQIGNAVTAIEALSSSRIELTAGQIKRGLESASVPARLEVIFKNPLVILDGAHNPDGAAAMYGCLKTHAGEFTAICGMMSDKDYKKVLKIAAPLLKSMIAVNVEGNSRGLPAEALAEAAADYINEVVVAADYDEALALAFEKSGGRPVLIFGSFYLAGDIRQKAMEYFKNRI